MSHYCFFHFGRKMGHFCCFSLSNAYTLLEVKNHKNGQYYAQNEKININTFCYKSIWKVISIKNILNIFIYLHIYALQEIVFISTTIFIVSSISSALFTRSFNIWTFFDNLLVYGLYSWTILLYKLTTFDVF